MRTSHSRRRPSRRGFSLIELGIVIAVIAVLAAVVIFGRGFIIAARVTKAIDASNTVRKAASTFAGLNGGSLAQVGNANQLNALQRRGLLPTPQGGLGSVWTVSGAEGSDEAVVVRDIRFGVHNPAGQSAVNAVAIRISTPTGTAVADDIRTAVQQDRNIIPVQATVGGLQCSLPTQVITGDEVTICFYL
jgi:prepilin-type N-terminal cleavage/methylation domain-containing protein